MRKFLAIALFVAWVSPASAYWQSVSQVSIASAPSGLQGPGDVVSGARMWWGLRGYNAAFTGNVANICDSATGLVCADVTWSGTALVFPTIGGVACNNVGNICVVKTLYDQTGNGNHVTQATLSKMPVLTLSCLGSLPCATYTIAAASCLVTGSSVAAITNPWSMEGIGRRTGNFTTSQRLVGNGTGLGNQSFGWTTSASTINLTGVTLGSVTDSSFHALQGVANGASTSISADGASNTGSITATTKSDLFGLGCTNNSAGSLDGQLTEGGVWPSAFSAQNIIDLNSNAHTYWGF